MRVKVMEDFRSGLKSERFGDASNIPDASQETRCDEWTVESFNLTLLLWKSSVGTLHRIIRSECLDADCAVGITGFTPSFEMINFARID